MDKMRNYMQHLVAGWDVQTVRDIVAETLHDLIDPLIYDEAASLIEEHHQAGRDVVIVSSSGEEVVVPIGQLLGADRVVATKMVVEDGRYTGDIAFYAYGENKAAAIRGLAGEAGYDLAESSAYSDSITDLPMLEAVGHPSVVNPDRALRKEALARGWDVLEFRNPVSLRARMPSLPTPTAPVVAGMAVGAGVAAAGWYWYARHRAGRAIG
jgi:HAD superfamily hydrolase (TIGR01490 family)